MGSEPEKEKTEKPNEYRECYVMVAEVVLMNTNKCPNCSQELPDGLKFCSQKCAELFKQKNENNGNDDKYKMVNAFKFGSGSNRRIHNINYIIKSLKTGKSEVEILLEGSLGFTEERLQEYIDLAKRFIQNEVKPIK